MFNQKQTLKLLVLLGLCILFSNVKAQPKIAVLDFELRDLTLLPGIPEEIARTASIKTLLEAELTRVGYNIVSVPLSEQKKATSGFGYLLDHHDVAAELGRRYQADYVIVGRLHKPSFLFVYLITHLIEVNNPRLVADYLLEVKGSDKKLTGKGVHSLAVKVHETLGGQQP